MCPAGLTGDLSRFRTYPQIVLRNVLRDVSALSRPVLIRVPDVNPRIHASIDYFLNRFAESGPAASNTGLRDNDWHAGIVLEFRSEDLCHGAAICRVS